MNWFAMEPGGLASSGLGPFTSLLRRRRSHQRCRFRLGRSITIWHLGLVYVDCWHEPGVGDFQQEDHGAGLLGPPRSRSPRLVPLQTAAGRACVDRLGLGALSADDPCLRVQVLQGDSRGHRGLRRHQRRVLRQRQTMVT